MQKVYLINHRGGDGVNFIIRLLAHFSSGFADTFEPNEFNNQFFCDHVFTGSDNICEKIQTNIKNGLPYDTDLVLKNLDGILLQQMHSGITRVSKNLEQHHYNDKFLCITTEDIKTQFMFAKLDVMKNKTPAELAKHNPTLYFRNKGWVSRQFILGRLQPYQNQYNINYNKLILNAESSILKTASFKEFEKLCNFFNKEPSITQDEFTKIVGEYAKTNKRLLQDFKHLDRYYIDFKQKAELDGKKFPVED